ncbi:hypoxia-inducible factor 1-alpha-like isoform X2 [Mya arenaria]|uniref:hypoxia-inducible factor 1-alpha-like isoform X2 n=1 Tax=Mya arenaria TaxID=6604 RepID=UPI0022E318F3|nr:hypoxia-inducible factor 1-alpha-like isoform X2 [Mya arenaria]
MPYRNTEKRKEKSRDAARCRRGKEGEIFSELASQLPLPMTTIDSLDKASVMRLLLSYLKVRSTMEKRPKLEVPLDDPLMLKLDTMYPKALDGILLLLSKEGDMIYISESVSKLLGLQQIDVMGQSIYDYAHPCDHEEIQEVLSPRSEEEGEGVAKTIFIRLKCTLTSKGRNVNLKSASYKVIKLTGRYIADHNVETVCEDDVLMRDPEEEDSEDEVRPFKPHPMPHFLAIAEGIHHPANIEVPLDRRTFISRHSMNMKFTDCDDRVKRLIGYPSEDLIGQSFFAYHHAIDSKMMDKAFKDLFSKGQISTGQYRFLAKNGGYVWMVTEATVIYNGKTQKPENVVCVHYVLSHVEQHGRVLASSQLVTSAPVVKQEVSPAHSPITRLPSPHVPSPCMPSPKQEEPANRPTCAAQSTTRVQQRVPRRDVKVADLFHLPKFSTEAVFAKKTDEMEEDFFPLDTKKHVGRNGLLDLTRHVQRDRDGCIPHDRPTPTAKTGLSQLSPYSERMRDPKKDPHLAPFIRRERSPCTSSGFTSPDRRSPEQTMSGVPSPPGYLTTINPKDISAMDNLFTTLDTVDHDQDIDFEMRAPYIPMAAEEDHILIEPPSDTYLNMGTDFNPGIFGCTESVFSLKDDIYEGVGPEKRSMSTRDMIGDSTVKKSIERPQDQMTMKMKRPLDRSCLEKGPPAPKILKYQPAFHISPNPVMRPRRDSSVLMNLLLRGEDAVHGYIVPNKQNISQSKGRHNGQLTSHDIEVNAPSNTRGLLYGMDLVNALNMARK